MPDRPTALDDVEFVISTRKPPSLAFGADTRVPTVEEAGQALGYDGAAIEVLRDDVIAYLGRVDDGTAIPTEWDSGPGADVRMRVVLR